MPHEFGIFYICPAFWHTPDTGFLSAPGGIVNLASRFIRNGESKVYAAGVENARTLARDNPLAAMMNADTLQFFAEDIPMDDMTT